MDAITLYGLNTQNVNSNPSMEKKRQGKMVNIDSM